MMKAANLVKTIVGEICYLMSTPSIYGFLPRSDKIFYQTKKINETALEQLRNLTKLNSRWSVPNKALWEIF